MCSSNKDSSRGRNSESRGGNCENLVELINGPIGNLVGIGARILIDRRTASAGSNPAGSKKQQENIVEFYDNIEAHLKGTLRVLKPAMEIKKILCGGECRSAGHERAGGNNTTRVLNYTPQRNRKKCRTSDFGRVGDCDGGAISSGGKPMIGNQTGTTPNKPSDRDRAIVTSRVVSLSSSSPYSCTDLSTPPQNRYEPNDYCGYKKFNVNRLKLEARSSIPREANTELCCRRDQQNRSSERKKEKKKDRKQQQQQQKKWEEGGAAAAAAAAAAETRSKTLDYCLICKQTPRDNASLAILPCKHSFCYPCLGKSKGPKCQKCDETFDMKNVAHFFSSF